MLRDDDCIRAYVVKRLRFSRLNILRVGVEIMRAFCSQLNDNVDRIFDSLKQNVKIFCKSGLRLEFRPE